MVARKISSVVVIAMIAAIVTPFNVQARPNDDRLDGGRISTQASQRLMKELKDFYKSDSYKRGLLAVELVDDNIYEWHVRYFPNDPKLPLFEGLQELKSNGGPDHILLHVMYNDNYPNEPPFVRVVYPNFRDGVLEGGAVCHQLLSKSGWNKEYTIEPMILQIAAETLPGTRFTPYRYSYEDLTYEEAKRNFDETVAAHENDGLWTTTPEPQQK